jgi:Winged helix DNA-binding domain
MSRPTMSRADLTWSQVCARRLTRHGLTAPVPLDRLADQVGVMCGAHAQVMAAAELSVGLRVRDTTRTDVRDALWRDRTLVKTYGPRGTVHLLPTRDLPLWTAALAAVPRPGPSLAPDVKFNPKQTDEVIAAIAGALTGANLTVDELNDAIVARTGTWAAELVMPAFTGMWPRWRQVITTAAERGVLCFGPNRGQKITYTNPALTSTMPGPAALGEVARAYLYAYGPASPAHFAQWLAAPRPWAATLFSSLDLEPVTVDGEKLWQNADEAADERLESTVRLLPYFDAYGVGSHPRPKVFPAAAADRALAGGQAGPMPILIVDGVVAGVWHAKRSGRRLAITVEPFVKLTAGRRRQLEDQAERIAEISEASASLAIGSVTVQAHW